MAANSINTPGSQAGKNTKAQEKNSALKEAAARSSKPEKKRQTLPKGILTTKGKTRGKKVLDEFNMHLADSVKTALPAMHAEYYRKKDIRDKRAK